MILCLCLCAGIEEDFVSWRNKFKRDVFPILLGEKAFVPGCGCGGNCACGDSNAGGDGCGSEECSRGGVPVSPAGQEVRWHGGVACYCCR